LAIFRDRLPSNRDISLLFASCVFPVHVWSIFNVLREVPAWILRLSSWEFIGIIAYTLAFALLESVIILLTLIFLGTILPARFLRDRFVAQSSMLVLLTSGWAIVAHYNDEVIRLWGIKEFLFWSLPYLTSLALAYVLIHRYERLGKYIRSLAERLTVLSFTFASIDFLGVIVVILRNVSGSIY